MRKLLLASILVAFSISGASADEPMLPRQRAEQFFKVLADKGTGPAFDLLFQGSSIPAQKPQAVDALKRQTEAALPVYGKILDSEFIEEKPFGTSVVSLTYILRLEQHPLVLKFWFYKPHDVWFLATITFNDQLQGLPD